MIEELAKCIPSELRFKSGNVFYSGRAAWNAPAEIYILGFNPGGEPPLIGASDENSFDTVGGHTRFILKNAFEHYSTWLDASWNSNQPGEAPLQKSMQHVMNKLGLDLRFLPSSNLVFPRSKGSSDLGNEEKKLIEQCWPFHQLVIDNLTPKVLFCFGVPTGEIAAKHLAAPPELFAKNKIYSYSYKAWKVDQGPLVFGLHHPSYANWTIPKYDPSDWIADTIASANINLNETVRE
ncbi:MAG: hypothetical protein GY927_11015 [bacterium]|nr:hypothetical protein [bacterium]